MDFGKDARCWWSQAQIRNVYCFGCAIVELLVRAREQVLSCELWFTLLSSYSSPAFGPHFGFQFLLLLCLALTI